MVMNLVRGDLFSEACSTNLPIRTHTCTHTLTLFPWPLCNTVFIANPHYSSEPHLYNITWTHILSDLPHHSNVKRSAKKLANVNPSVFYKLL